MNRTMCNLLVTGASLLVGVGAIFAADSAKPVTKRDYESRYKVLTDENMFLRDRRLPPSSRPGGPGRGVGTGDDTAPGGRNSTEAKLVLTGIVIEEGQYRAYVEDIPNSKVMRLAVGDAVAHGHVTAIEIDAIAYEMGTQPTWVLIGNDFRGVPYSSGGSYASSGSSGRTSPTTNTFRQGGGNGGPPADVGPTPPPLDPESANLSMEERMRLRRLQGK
jgi:hypothetical protein